MRIFLFLSQGIIPESVLSVDTTDYAQHQQLEIAYLESGIGKVSFEKGHMTDQERLSRVRSYYKFVFVRHPLERLLSAYLDKIAALIPYNVPLNVNTYPTRFQADMWGKYTNGKRMQLKGGFYLNMTFVEYIQWIIDSDQDELNEHYAPLISNAQPCRIRYDFYGSFKLYNSEMSHLIKKLDANPKYFPNVSYHKSGKKTEDLVDQYYSQLPEKLKQKLFQKYYQELDFYYHLYPEDSLSHVHTLGVEEEVPVYCTDCT